MRPRQRAPRRDRPRTGPAHQRVAAPRGEDQAAHRALQRARRGGHPRGLPGAHQRLRAGGARCRPGDRRGGPRPVRQPPDSDDGPRDRADGPARGPDPRLRRREHPSQTGPATRLHGRAPPRRRLCDPVRRRAADHLPEPRTLEGNHPPAPEVQVGRSREPGQQGAEDLRGARRAGLAIRVQRNAAPRGDRAAPRRPRHPGRTRPEGARGSRRRPRHADHAEPVGHLAPFGSAAAAWQHRPHLSREERGAADHHQGKGPGKPGGQGLSGGRPGAARRSQHRHESLPVRRRHGRCQQHEQRHGHGRRDGWWWHGWRHGRHGGGGDGVAAGAAWGGAAGADSAGSLARSMACTTPAGSRSGSG